MKIEISQTAVRQLKKLDKVVQKRILSFLRKLGQSNQPRIQGKALKGDKSTLWRYRVNDYRLICHIIDETVTVLVLAIGHRKDIYK